MAKHTLQQWLVAARPWALPASMMPVLVTLSYLYYIAGDATTWSWSNGWLGMLGVAFLHSGGNLISDYHDFRQAVDRVDTYGAKTLTSGLFSPHSILQYGVCCLIVGVAIGLLITLRSSWELIWIGGAGLIAAIFYYLFKFRALGDLLIFVAFGYLPVIGTIFVVTGVWSFSYLFLALPVGAITVAILHANNTRDILSDRQAEITTLAMLLKVNGSIIYYRLLIGTPYIIIIALIIYQRLPLISLITLLSIPLAWRNSVKVGQAHLGAGPIAHLDEMTAKLQMAFGLTLSISLLIATWL